MRHVGWIPVLVLLTAFEAAAQGPAPGSSFVDANAAEPALPGSEPAGAEPASADLPDSPGTVWSSSLPGEPYQTNAESAPLAVIANPSAIPCLPTYSLTNYGPAAPNATPVTGMPVRPPCQEIQNPYRPFVDASKSIRPLTSRQKAKLAMRDVRDPFNLLTIAGTSAYYVGTTPHNPYGPGMRGFGYSAGVSLSQDVTNEVIGTYAVCSLFHQDPRYFRMPHARPLRRLVHAISHVAIAQGDNGRPIPNYSNFITSAVSAEISNLYVPGIATNAPSTVDRIFGGFLTEPIGTIIAEFLPDVASHIHVNIVILQRYINQISAQNGPAQPAPSALFE